MRPTLCQVQSGAVTKPTCTPKLLKYGVLLQDGILTLQLVLLIGHVRRSIKVDSNSCPTCGLEF